MRALGIMMIFTGLLCAIWLWFVGGRPRDGGEWIAYAFATVICTAMSGIGAYFWGQTLT